MYCGADAWNAMFWLCTTELVCLKKQNKKCCDICVGASDQCLGRFGTAVHVEMGLGVLVWQGPLEPSTSQAATFL